MFLVYSHTLKSTIGRKTTEYKNTHSVKYQVLQGMPIWLTFRKKNTIDTDFTIV